MDFQERFESQQLAVKSALEGHQSSVWTSLPGIITSFDPASITAQVQPSICALRTGPDGKQKWLNPPLLPDVPVVFPRGGGYELTFPIKNGDECLVVFSSRCIDNWWAQGGVQTQRELRMHDLSDGFAIIGPWSQKTKISNISTSTVQLRTDDGKLYAEIDHDKSTISTITPQTQIIQDDANRRITATTGATTVVQDAGTDRITSTAGPTTIVQDGTANRITMTAGATTILQDGAANVITLSAGSTTLVINGNAGTITTTGTSSLSMTAPTINLN